MSENRTLMRQILSWIRHGSISIVVGVTLAVVIREFAFQSFFIPSSSMFPTLKVDQHILVDKAGFFAGDVKRGDVIVFRDPGGWLGPPESPHWDPLEALRGLLLDQKDSGYLVKRVIGVGGDTVVCCSDSGELVRNGKPLQEGYLSLASGSASETAFEVLVPKGQFWVMGDNRIGSTDSRHHTPGFVDKSKVIGVVLAITWPIESIELIERIVITE